MGDVRDGQGRQAAVAMVEAGRGRLFEGGVDLVVADDSALWVAWEAAKEAWLERKRQRTAAAYRTAVRQFFEWAEVAPWEVSPLVAQEWTLWMEREGKVVETRDEETGEVVEGRTGLAKSTINLKLAAMSSFYDFVQWDYVSTTPDGRVASLWPTERMNPFDTVDRKKVSPYGRSMFPTVEELKRMLGVINTTCRTGKRDFALLYTIATTCRRFSEIVNLRWGDVRELADGRMAFRYAHKEGEEREAELPRACYQAILAYLRADGRPPEEMGEDDHVFVPLFPNRVLRMSPDMEVDPNQPISNRQANRILKKYARRAGVDEEKAHIHGLRHAGLRLRAEQMRERKGGIDYLEIMEVAGHSSLAVTQIYVQEVLDPEDPEDPGGDAAAAELLPKEKPRRRRKVAAAEQMALGMNEGAGDNQAP